MRKRIAILGTAGVAAAIALVVLALILSSRSSTNIVQAQTPVAGGGGVDSGVTVMGTGSVTVKPDVAHFVVGVEVKAAEVSTVQQEANTKTSAIVDALKKGGVDEKDIVTTSYDIQPNYVYTNNQPPKMDGYSIRSQLAVTVRALDKAGSIIDAAVNAGANTVGNIQFTLENNGEAVKQARQEAIADAKAKADQLAAAGGFGLGSITSVTEVSSPAVPPQRTSAGVAAAGAASAAPSTSLESGQLKVQVNVQVVYAIK